MMLTFPRPATPLAAGSYFFIVEANWGGTIADNNPANNTDAGDAPVAVA
jgi:hypothetical protein